MIDASQFISRFPEFAGFHALYPQVLSHVITDTLVENDYDWLSANPALQELAQGLHTSHNYLTRMREILQISGQSTEEIQRAIGALIIKQDDDLYGRVDYDVSATVDLLKDNRNSSYWERLQTLLRSQTQLNVGFLAFGPSPFVL